MKVLCKVAANNVRLHTDVVEADISHLLGKETMKKAQVKLALVKDTAANFGETAFIYKT